MRTAAPLTLLLVFLLTWQSRAHAGTWSPTGRSSARRLLAPGEVTSETTVQLDADGGVPPFSERLASVQEDLAARQELVALNVLCANGDADACTEYQAGIEAEEEATTRGEEETAPCYQNIFLSILLGTYCDLPPTANLGQR